jgi:pSer/pThr/pTyr-binding forkhead associated (FHA) protein
VERRVPVLEIDDGKGERRQVELVGDVTRVGRAVDNDVRIADPRVSKHHLELRREAGRVLVLDTGSKAGVYVNGAPATRRELADGDELTLGPRSLPRLVFRAASADTKPDSRTTLILKMTDTKGSAGLEKLSRFLELSRLFGGKFDLDEILENVVDLAVEITGAERGFLIVLRPGKGLELRIARGAGAVAIARDGARVSETIVARSRASSRT